MIPVVKEVLDGIEEDPALDWRRFSITFSAASKDDGPLELIACDDVLIAVKGT